MRILIARKLYGTLCVKKILAAEIVVKVLLFIAHGISTVIFKETPSDF